ncbi:hypothetical protein LINPERHAP1_LOCUS29731 [Linum perenne]
MTEGDRNTQFFNLATLRRRTFNKITRLRDLNGNCVTSQTDLMSMTIEYFSYKTSGEVGSARRVFYAKIDAVDQSSLCRELYGSEIS